MISKYSIPVALIIVLTGCVPSIKQESKISYNKPILDSLFNRYGSNLAIISCLRCGCFVEAYNQNLKLQKLNGYTLLADTNCNMFNFRVENLDRRLIDSLSEDIYNLTLIKNTETGPIFKILKTEESEKIDRIADRFFN